MTIFGYDCSEHQQGFDHAQAYKEGYRFVIVRTNQGTYEDKACKDHIKAIRKTKLLLAVYLRVGDTSTPTKNASVLNKMTGGDKSIPVWIDSEDPGVTEAKTYQVAQALKKLGYTVAGAYLPQWFWGNIGKPKLRIGPLWASHYVEGTGFGSALYEKVPAAWWRGYGGQKVKLLQFSEKAKVAGQVIDVSAFTGTKTALTKLFSAGGTTPKPAPDPAPDPAVLSVDGVPLPDFHTSGTKILWRPLWHNNNVKATKTCYCVTQAIALAEARLIKMGVIKECLDMWQFGYGQAAAASADTHAAGGVVDTVQIDAKTQKVLREVGFAGAWYRGPGAQYGNFSTKHIHAVLAGCPHVSNGAGDQITSVRNGRNGLANNGPDYGPNVPYITWQDAWKKYVTGAAPTPAPAPAPIDQEELDVATQAPVRHRSKPQVVKPTKNGEHKILLLDDKGNVSWAFGAGRYEMAAYIRFEGIDANDELRIQAAIVDTEPGTGKVLSTHYNCQVGLKGGDGESATVYRWRWNVAAPPKGRTRRLRIAAQNFTGKDITINEMYVYNWRADL